MPDRSLLWCIRTLTDRLPPTRHRAADVPSGLMHRNSCCNRMAYRRAS